MNGKVTYRQQFTRCGKPRCRKCRDGGSGHGPYWYAYWSENGKTISKYIGTRLPEHIEATQLLRKAEGKELSHHTSRPALRIYLLGQFRIERKIGDEWVAVDSRTWHRRRARALLGCLLSNPGRRLGREQVMEYLWPELDITVAANRLNGAVHELRLILEPDIARPAASRMLRLERDILELADSTYIWVDAEAFESLIKEASASSDPRQARHLLEQAAELYQGHYLLEELYSEWAAHRRDALQRAWIGLLLKLTDLYIEQEAYVNAMETLDRLRTAEPTNETALQRLMLLLTHLDRRGEALQVYRRHVLMLQREYESDPLPETVALYEALRKGHIPPMPGSKTAQQPTSTAKTPPAGHPEGTRKPFHFLRPAFQLGRHNQSPLIGREQEFHRLRQLLRTLEATEAQRPHPDGGEQLLTPQTGPSVPRRKTIHFALLQGETGIGKTRLAEELSMEAYARGWAIAWSRSFEQETSIPYRPWTELLRALLSASPSFYELLSQDQQGLTTLPFHIERLSGLLPELARYNTQFQRSVPAVFHEQERLLLWEATLGLLGMIGQTQPLLLVLDDLHWTDASSIDLLTYLVHHLQDQRVLILATCRDGELPAQHKLRTLIADLCREQAIVAITVQPLTHAQIGSLVSHLPQEVVENIQQQAAGNPFFAEELARAIVLPTSTEERQGQRETTTGMLPEAISSVLERRLGRLSAECQNLLSKAAVLGGSFELRHLLPMTREQSEDAVLDLLEEALYAGLLTEEGTGAHITYHFWHPLIISHLYERLSAARRAQLHRKAAEAIQVAHSDTMQEKIASEIVYHLCKGGGDTAQLIHYAELAGHRAYNLGSYSEALRYYVLALQALSGQQPSPLSIQENTELQSQLQQQLALLAQQDRVEHLHHTSLLVEYIAECCSILGLFTVAQAAYHCTLALRTRPDFLHQAYPAEMDEAEKERLDTQIQGLLLRELGHLYHMRGDGIQAHHYYEEARRTLMLPNSTKGIGWVCVQISIASLFRIEGHFKRAQQYLQEALATFSDCTENQICPFYEMLPTASQRPQTRIERILTGNSLEVARGHEVLGLVESSLGNQDAALKHLHLAAQFFEQVNHILDTARIYNNLSTVYITLGELQKAYTYLQQALSLAERSGDLPLKSTIIGNFANIYFFHGNLQEAENYALQCLALKEEYNGREGVQWFCVRMAYIQLEKGDLQQAGTYILRALKLGRLMKNRHSISFARLSLNTLRIYRAIMQEELYLPEKRASRQLSVYSLQLLRRAQYSLHHILTTDDVEIEPICIYEAQHLLAYIAYLLHDLEQARQLAEHVVNEINRTKAWTSASFPLCLMGLIANEQRDYQQADSFFMRALNLGHKFYFRLDYANTLYYYASALLARQTEEGQRQALSYLYKARQILVKAHAHQPLSYVQKLIKNYEKRSEDVS
ncbi:transcriptional regulator [Thermosporothrix hazakensis]|jgi:predicted ATPase/DNA-binding SARP family transcriptional activator|uniref:Transcriptional regulator n=1 Tax=Thermosporothrix hazakensis TaxID=644383 RepID=A0A326U8H4_THEHA|nr:DUF6788 family protein [Thermosporothrix hazakensis]PZW30545.1 transcriptional regulator [Thermosporothrix hazakensis]GCE49406.1 hypothetical protein KTH_42750 [Thermosporothrix hazakensis]